MIRYLRKIVGLKSRSEMASGGGERQAAKKLSGIRADHIGRYEFAKNLIPDGSHVIDMACGVGYGSYIIATQTNCQSILAVDINSDAINYARSFYASDKITYELGDCLEIELSPEYYDAAISFETVEHIEDASLLLQRFYSCLRPGGLLILSTPNEDNLPYTEQRFPFHVRHYTKKDLQFLIESSKFRIVDVFSQNDAESKLLVSGWDGLFNIVVCERNR